MKGRCNLKQKLFSYSSLFLLFVLFVSACSPNLVSDQDVAGKTAMSVIYDQIHSSVYSAWMTGAFIAALFVILGVAAIVTKATGNSGGGCLKGALLGVIVGVIVFFIMLMIGSAQATKAATHGVEVGADTGKTRKANQYVEKLHVFPTRALQETRKCHESDSGTGCKFYWTYNYNYHEECTTKYRTDEDGNSEPYEDCQMVHDTRYVPYFTEEWRFSANFSMPDSLLYSKVCLEYSGKDDNGDGKEDCNKFDDSHTGLMKSDIPDNPVKYYYDPRFDPGSSGIFGDDYGWQAPENYEAYLWGPSNRNSFEPYSLNPFPFVVPGEWKAMDAALKADRPYVATFRHDYVNWVFASDAQNMTAQSSQIQKYKDLGVLPSINMPYSRYGSDANFALDYDFVQFLGGLQVSNPTEWQDAAGFTAINVGPRLEGSMLVFFAPANLIDDPTAWIIASKAYLSDKNTWGMTLAPKNLILIGCGVDTATNTISFCRMETGMPTGNVGIKFMVDHMQPMSFTVESVFGSPVAQSTPRGDGFYDTSVSIPQNGFIRNLFGRTDAQFAEMMDNDPGRAPKAIEWFKSVGIQVEGFLRVRMKSLDWLKTDIKLEASDINWVIETESKGAMRSAAFTTIFFIVVGCFMLGSVFLDQ